MGTLQQPPRFGTPGNGQGPKTVADWVAFYRWLVSLWQKAASSTTDQQVRTFIPQQPGVSFDGFVGAARAFERAQPPQSQAWDAGAAAAAAFEIHQPPARTDDAQLALALALRSRVPMPAPPAVLQDTHAHRPNYSPEVYANGTLFFETDRTVYYINQGDPGARKWVYSSGEFLCTQANIPNDLGANDAGFLTNVSDYGHLLMWSGAAWKWGPGDAGSGMLQLFEVDPTGAGWHLYDGTANVPYLKADGTLGTITLPNLSGAAPTKCYLKTSDTNGGPTAPIAPTFAGGTSTPTGTASAPVFTGAALGNHAHDAPVGSVSATVGFLTSDFGTGGNHTRSVDFTTASSAASSSVFKTSAASAGTPAGTVSAPVLTMDPLTISGTAGTNGEPENLTRRAWFRQ